MTTSRLPALLLSGLIAAALAACDVTGPDADPLSVELFPDSVWLSPGETQRMAAVVKDAAGTRVGAALQWSSGTPSVATADTAVVTAQGAGTTTVYVEAGGGLDSAVVVVEESGIRLEQIGPDPRAPLVGDSAWVTMDVQSTYEVDRVVVRAGNSTYPLVRESGWYRGWIPLSAGGTGAAHAVAEAFDVHGNSARRALLLVQDRPPVISVTAPENPDLVQGEVAVTAECSDDWPEGCSKLWLSIWSTGVMGRTVFESDTAKSALQVTAALPVEPEPYRIAISAEDAAGRVSHRTLFVHSVAIPAGWEPIADLPGYAADYDLDRAAWLVDRGHVYAEEWDLQVGDLAGGSATTAGVVRPGLATHLVPDGVFYGPWTFFRFSDAGVTVQNGRFLRRAGDYYLWRDSPNVWRGGPDGQVLITSDPVSGADLAENGRVVYSVADTVYLWENGAVTPVGPGSAPTTDGASIAYIDAARRLLHVDEAGVVEVVSEAPYHGAVLRDGYLVYEELSSSIVLQVWARSPDGTRSQVTTFGSSSRLESLGPDGRIVVHRGIPPEPNDPDPSYSSEFHLAVPPYGLDHTIRLYSSGESGLPAPRFIGDRLHVLVADVILRR